jgi:hypothetical protein
VSKGRMRGTMKRPGSIIGEYTLYEIYDILRVALPTSECREKLKELGRPMTEENRVSVQKQLKARFVDESVLITHFVNTVNVRGGLEEFYVTLGTALPIEVAKPEDLENIDTVEAQPLFRCAITRQTMKQIIDLLQAVYDQNTKQLESLRSSQIKEQEE